MTEEQYQAAIKAMKTALPPDAMPHRADPALKTCGPSIATAHLNHVAWMLYNMPPFGDKGMRWLGFAQGVLWSTGETSIDQLREMNMA